MPDYEKIGGETSKTRADSNVAERLDASSAYADLIQTMQGIGLQAGAVIDKWGKHVESEHRRLEDMRILHLSLATLGEEIIDASSIHASIEQARQELDASQKELQQKHEAIQRLQDQANRADTLATNIQELEADVRLCERRIGKCQKEMSDRERKLEQLTQAIEKMEGKIASALAVVIPSKEVQDIMEEVRQFIRDPNTSSTTALLEKLRDVARANRSPALQQAVMMAEAAQYAHQQGTGVFDTSKTRQEHATAEEQRNAQQAALLAAQQQRQQAEGAGKQLSMVRAEHQALIAANKQRQAAIEEQEEERLLQRGALHGAVGYFLSDALQADLTKTIQEGRAERADACLANILAILRKMGVLEGAMVTITVATPISFNMPKRDEDLPSTEKNAVVTAMQEQLRRFSSQDRTPHAEAFHSNDMRDYVTLTQRESPTSPTVWVGVRKDGSATEWSVQAPEDVVHIPFADLRYIYRKRGSAVPAPTP